MSLGERQLALPPSVIASPRSTATLPPRSPPRRALKSRLRMSTPAPLVLHHETPAAPKPCTNCGDPRVDVFCARCGEKQPNHHDLAIGHFVHEVVHELIHLDSKLFRTMRDLVLQPGKLTAEYFAGRKKRYIAPIRLFLTLWALTFIAYSSYKSVAIFSLDGLMALDPKQQLQQAFEKAAAKRKMPVAELQTRIEARWQKNMSLVSLLSIVSLAVLLKLLYIRHRRWLTEHLVFSTHFMCFMYVMSLLLWPVYLAVGFRPSVATHVLATVTFILACLYIFMALKRVYGQGGAKTLVKSVAVWIGTFLTTMFLMTGTMVVAILQVLGG
jgi:Protein of unknown function (DUF3667)